jgi:hypothetical protein
MTDPLDSPDNPVEEGAVIIEYRHGTIDYHGLRVPEAIYRFMKEIQDKKQVKL